MTITIHTRLDWRVLPSILWLGFVCYAAFVVDWRRLLLADHALDLILFVCISLGILLSLIRRERIEIYPDCIVWRKTYFGITRSKSAPLADVSGTEWAEGEDRGKGGKELDHVEFYLSGEAVKACYGFTFDEFDRMREDIRGIYPDLIKRWGRAPVRSKDFTLLNLS